MFIRALSLAAKRAVGVTCRRADVFAHQFHTPLPQSTLTAAATAVSTSNVIWQRSISTSPPLLSSSDKDDKGDEEREEISDEKKIHDLKMDEVEYLENMAVRTKP
mmetsp:Transcript_10687/g.19751  ORF Transcript_10687/g.19751 Transcript_10687/m.19751 type:complete len:105 (+) Transcript_10687:110-424(+)